MSIIVLFILHYGCCGDLLGVAMDPTTRFVEVGGHDGYDGLEVLTDYVEGRGILCWVAADGDVGDVTATANVKVHVVNPVREGELDDVEIMGQECRFGVLADCIVWIGCIVDCVHHDGVLGDPF